MALSAFGKAFAEARKAGDKEFTFNGKKFSTKMASDEVSSVGGTPKFGEYKSRAPYSDRGNELTSANYKTRAQYSDRGNEMTSANAVPRDTYKPDTSEVDRVKNLMDASGVSLDRKDEAGNAYKKGGKVKSVAKGWGIARGARKAKMY